MLLLIRTYRHNIRLVQQNIRRHQAGIGKQPGIHIVCVLLGLVLKLGHTGQLAKLGVAVQQPAQLGMGGHMGLDKHNTLVRIQT